MNKDIEMRESRQVVSYEVGERLSILSQLSEVRLGAYSRLPTKDLVFILVFYCYSLF